MPPAAERSAAGAGNVSAQKFSLFGGSIWRHLGSLSAPAGVGEAGAAAADASGHRVLKERTAARAGTQEERRKAVARRSRHRAAAAWCRAAYGRSRRAKPGAAGQVGGKARAAAADAGGHRARAARAGLGGRRAGGAGGRRRRGGADEDALNAEPPGATQAARGAALGPLKALRCWLVADREQACLSARLLFWGMRCHDSSVLCLIC
jgi:hypothetical protein